MPSKGCGQQRGRGCDRQIPSVGSSTPPWQPALATSIVAPVIIRTLGAVAGEVVQIKPHPNAQKVWLSYVRVDDSQEVVQIVFGGIRSLFPGDLVPVALPGARVIVAGRHKPKKMRNRCYRGERSHGMLCSLRELGWVDACVDEVAVLLNLRPGQRLDDIDETARPTHVEKWSDAVKFAEV